MQSEKKETAPPLSRTLKEYTLITAAVLIMDIGIYVFKFPNNFSFGGVTGLAVVLSAVSPLSAGTYNFIINMALLVLGFQHHPREHSRNRGSRLFGDPDLADL